MTQTPHDSDRHASKLTTSRRGFMASLGLAGFGSGTTSAQVGGGPEGDGMSNYRVPYYRVPESDLDSPGIVGRRAEITSGGTEWSAGDQLVDTGSSWELIDSGYGSVNADSLQNKIQNRSVWTDSTITVSVPTDYETIQDAINDVVPLTADHFVTINVDDGDYSDEDLLIAQTLVGRADGQTEDIGWEHKLKISGNPDTPSNVKVGSVVMNGVTGGIVTVDGMELQNANPYDDEDSPFAAYHCNEAAARDLAFGNTTELGAAITSYGSNVQVSKCSFGTDIFTNAVKTKHNGEIMIQRVGASEVSGQTTGTAHYSESGRILAHSDATLTGSPTYGADPVGQGIVRDEQGRQLAPDPVAFGLVAANNMTFVSAHLSTDKSGSSGEDSSLIETTRADNRSEINGSNNFVPDRGGWYEIRAFANFNDAGGSGTSDRLALRVRNETDGTVKRVVSNSNANINQTPSVQFSDDLKLTDGKEYDVVVTNLSDSYQLNGNAENTSVLIKRSTAQDGDWPSTDA